MQTNTKLGIITALALILATGVTAQPATLASLRSTYQNAAAVITAETYKQKAEALERYGLVLDALSTSSKQKGDLYTYTAVDAEKTRYLAEKNVPTNTPPAAVANAVALYGKQIQAIGSASDGCNVYLLKQYISALGILIKELMVANRIEEAKATSEEKSSAEFMLAELETAMPVVKEAAKTNVEAKVISDEYSIRGDAYKGTSIGRFKKGETITIQYVSGRWTGNLGGNMSSPDEGPEMAQLCQIQNGAMDRRQVVVVTCDIPRGTRNNPFVYVIENDGEYAIHKYDSAGETSYKDNSGVVRYKVTSGNKGVR